jgi:hypothetical protein
MSSGAADPVGLALDAQHLCATRFAVAKPPAGQQLGQTVRSCFSQDLNNPLAMGPKGIRA